MGRAALALILSCLATPVCAYDPPRPTVAEAMKIAETAFVGRVVEAREVVRDDGTYAEALLDVECHLVGPSSRSRAVRIRYRAVSGSDERDLAVPLAVGNRYLFAFRTVPKGKQVTVDTYAARTFVFELDTLPDYRVARQTEVMATLMWFQGRREVLTFAEVVSAAERNRAHARAPICSEGREIPSRAHEP